MMEKNGSSHMTWDELLDEYFFSHNLRSDTEWSYRKVVSRVNAFFGEHKLPENITHRDILQWRRATLNEQGLSPNTWNNRVAHLRALFNFGIEEGLLCLDKNPLNNSVVQRGIKKKKTLNKKQLTRVYLVMQQFEAYENANLTNHTRRCAIYPAWFWLTVLDALRYTGMRLNQLLHIRISDVNIDDGYLQLQLEGSKTHREWCVPIVRQLRGRLKQLIINAHQTGAEQSDFLFDVKRFRPDFRADDYVYDAKDALQSVRSFFRRLTKECKFIVSPHRFRHTLATELMAAPDRNLQLVKELLGHRSVSTTMEYVEIKMDVVGKTLEQELSLYTDLGAENDFSLRENIYMT
ncbi:TPA: site-specific integrase [Salmonella enterica]|uniref:tyrosine-type recombinase/integrase n=1 Tax=Salmonella enterica TaxID=28901 RepID=UPI0009B0F0AD|nr:site-specific integrase [Salmonella enterica]HBD1844084.1 site-specific integrase [Salmonella enterica]